MKLNINKIRESREKIETLKKELKEQQKAAFNEGAKELFASYRRLKEISFKAYVPYFCDGDPCEYSVQDYLINGFDKYDDEDDSENEWENLTALAEDREWNGREFTPKKYEPEAKEIVDTVKEFMGCFDEDFWRELGGDHAEITINAEGIEVEEYTDHD